MKKRVQKMVAVMLLVSLMLTACATPQEISTEESRSSEEVTSVGMQNIPDEIPTILIKSGETEIPYLMAPTVWNGKMFKRRNLLSTEEIFQIVTKLASGASISIDFLAYPPESITMTRTLFHLGVAENDGYKYIEGEIEPIELEEKDGKYTFMVPPPYGGGAENALTMMAAPEESPFFYGYTLTVGWGDNVCDYAILVDILAI